MLIEGEEGEEDDEESAIEIDTALDRKISEDILFIDKKCFNFKKYLEINFFMNKTTPVDKTKTIYELKSQLNDSLSLDFSLNIIG
jgi:hypothetical protein